MELTLLYRIPTSAIYAFACFSSSFASGALSPANSALAHCFNISGEVALLSTLTLFLLGYVAGPFIWAPMSESQGRKIPYAISMFGFICFGAGLATAKDYQTLCLTRFFQRAMGACPISITTSAYADMYGVFDCGYATTIFVSLSSCSSIIHYGSRNVLLVLSLAQDTDRCLVGIYSVQWCLTRSATGEFHDH